MWNHYDQTQIPDSDIIREYIGSPLWDKFYSEIIKLYKCKTIVEYSKCSFQSGWNMKFKKRGKSLCTAYPLEGGFNVMVVIGNNEAVELSYMLPNFCSYTQHLFKETNPGNNSKWLMFEIKNENILNDVFDFIDLRYKCSIKK